MFGLGLRSCFTRQYIDKSTPATIVASNYVTQQNMRPQRLQNGWIIFAAYKNTATTGVYFYKWQVPFADGAATQLCFINTTDGFNAGSMSSYGNNIYFVWSTGGTNFYNVNFDATTVSNTDRYSTRVTVDTQTNCLGASIAVDATGVLHTAWTSKNATYPNSFNVRYSKSTSGTTWDIPTQITVYNGAADNNANPCIAIMSNNNPIILFQNAQSGARYIMSHSYSGSAWLSQVIVFNAGGAFDQISPIVVVSNDGHIHIAWYGFDSTYTLQENIFYSESTNNGASWTAKTYITTGNTIENIEPTITVDRQNNVYIVYNRGYIAYKKFDGTAWGAETQLTTTGASPSTCSNYLDYIKPMTVYRDTAAVKFVGNFYA